MPTTHGSRTIWMNGQYSGTSQTPSSTSGWYFGVEGVIANQFYVYGNNGSITTTTVYSYINANPFAKADGSIGIDIVGAGSRLALGDGTALIKMTVGSEKLYSGSLVLADSAILICIG